jgi:hypothetical protein
MTKVVKPKKEKVATVKKATNLVQRATGGSLAQQLRLLGLRVVTIQADGNCLFVRQPCPPARLPNPNYAWVLFLSSCHPCKL